MSEFEKKYLCDGPSDSELHQTRAILCPKCGSDMKLFDSVSPPEIAFWICKECHWTQRDCGHEEKVKT